MWFGWFILISLLEDQSFSFLSGGLVPKLSIKDKFINPNDWSQNGNDKPRGRIEVTPYDHEGYQPEQPGRKTEMAKTTADQAVIDYVTVRRFINLLLRKAHFEDLAGNTVTLESISSPEEEKLIMSFMVSLSLKEMKMLHEFGHKKNGPYLRQIDEIFTNLMSAQEPNLVSRRCRQPLWEWVLEIGNILHNMTWQIDFMVVVYLATVAYIIWSLKLTMSRECSWKNIILCFLLPSIVWEFSRLLEEENLKQYSEELRLGNIPGHCLGIDNRRWWEVLIGHKSEAVQCYEYHSLKKGRPVLKVSIFKVLLTHFEQLLGVVVTLTKTLTASSPDDGYFTNIIMRTVVWMCVTFAVVAIVAIYIFTKHPVVRWASSSPAGSRVEPVEYLPSEQVSAPPRRRRGRGGNASRGQQRRPVEQVDGNPKPAIVYEVTGHNVSEVVSATEPLEAASLGVGDTSPTGGGGKGDEARGVDPSLDESSHTAASESSD